MERTEEQSCKLVTAVAVNLWRSILIIVASVAEMSSLQCSKLNFKQNYFTAVQSILLFRQD